MDLDRYEESYEDRHQHDHAFTRIYQTQDESIGQIMRRFIKDRESENQQKKATRAHHCVEFYS